ncbi:LLM class flavin-dependent oxidoreductase [Streptacidiphilus fuscans]|uniref:LLM class flavin-dependent oxidoreductase n=1 Tax=Streptacidiphilus fuscans TaxID=2789292 RepID=A0A931FF67_9ACTN|nr:LLM class flavin-dependent oxidoreductase [Streptacidiphilus fuscans]MBF9069965.1 LLM class flavin-dependent oxidoreductase [Streptacidiphilus fuscans]
MTSGKSHPRPHLHLAVALADAGAHPAAWREPGARPDELFTARYWADQVAEAERGLLDLVTFEDGLGMQSSLPDRPDERTDRVRGRLDAGLLAARVAPLTRRIGLLPTAVATHTEPFHLSKAVATLDYISAGRAGLQVTVSPRPDVADHFGRRSLTDPAPGETLPDLLDEAADYVEAVRRLWDSWEDDAEIRDAATGRFVDREKLHYIDFEGRHFSVRGPSITPRPPQGQPLVAIPAHGAEGWTLAGRAADLAFVAPHSDAEAATAVAGVRSAQQQAGRGDEPLHVLADLTVYLDDSHAAAVERLSRLDEAAGGLGADIDGYGFGYGAPGSGRGTAEVFAGTPADLADLLLAWQHAGLSGFRLHPGVLAHDLPAIVDGLVPELQRRGVYRRGYDEGSLRARFGLARPVNRYALSGS